MMAKSAIRPLLLLVAFVIAGGCAPPLGLENRPCPCGAGFDCCAATNMCIRPGDECAMPAVEAPMAWVHTPMVRQSDSLLVTLTGSDGRPPTTNPDFAVSLRSGTRSSYDVRIPPGAPLGAVDVSFFATSGAPHHAKQLFVVTEITVSPIGSDLGRGTPSDPFRTFKQAVLVAGKGDTIQLLNNRGGYSVSTGESDQSWVPHDVTVQGESPTDTRLVTALQFDGDAVLRNLSFDIRAHVTKPGSAVIFDKVISGSGLSVDESAAGARIEITGRSALRSDDAPTLLVQAPDVTIKLSGGSSLERADDDGAEAVRLEGRAPIIDISNSSVSATGANALVDLGGATFTMAWSEISGKLNFAHPEGTAHIMAGTFQMSRMKGSAGITFGGRILSVLVSNFWGMGIYQDSPGSEAVVHGCRFTEFAEPAYVLVAGSLDLGNKEEPGQNMFMGRRSRTGAYPLALSVLAKPGMAWATSRATSFNGQVPTPAAVMGPARTPEYEISDKVPINFY